MRKGRIALAVVVLAAGGAAAWSLRRREVPPPAPPAPRTAATPAVVHAEPAEARLLDTIEPAGAETDAARLAPIAAIGPAPPGTALPAQPTPEKLVSWSANDPQLAAELPPELTRPYPEAIEPAAPGVVRSVSQAAGSKPADAAETTTLFHEVRDGDTLASLARRYLGHSDRATVIYEANRDLLSHPDVLPLGARLKVPVPRDAARAEGAPDADRLVPLRP